MLQRAFAIGVLGALFALSAGCQSSGSDGQGNTEKTAGTKQVTLEVTGMTWPIGWPPRVQKALETLPWVRKVQVDFAKKQAIVTVETGGYDEKTLLKALEKGGFGGKVAKQ